MRIFTEYMICCLDIWYEHEGHVRGILTKFKCQESHRLAKNINLKILLRLKAQLTSSRTGGVMKGCPAISVTNCWRTPSSLKLARLAYRL